MRQLPARVGQGFAAIQHPFAEFLLQLARPNVRFVQIRIEQRQRNAQIAYVLDFFIGQAADHVLQHGQLRRGVYQHAGQRVVNQGIVRFCVAVGVCGCRRCSKRRRSVLRRRKCKCFWCFVCSRVVRAACVGHSIRCWRGWSLCQRLPCGCFFSSGGRVRQFVGKE